MSLLCIYFSERVVGPVIKRSITTTRYNKEASFPLKSIQKRIYYFWCDLLARYIIVLRLSTYEIELHWDFS